MKFLNSKTILSIIFPILLAAIVIKFNDSYHSVFGSYLPATVKPPVVNKPLNKNSPADKSLLSMQDVTSNTKDLNSISSTPAESKNTTFTTREISQVKEWSDAHGYSSKELMATYNSYSDSILEELGKQGDARALEALGGKFVAKGESSKARSYYFQAAALGSTIALIQLSSILEPNPTDGETDEMRQNLRRETAIESLALMKIAEIRGDTNIAKVGSQRAINSYEHRYGSINLTDLDQQYIQQKTEELYNSLQARRTKLGFGDFDNEVPRFVKAINENTK